MELGEKLLRARQEAGLSQRQLCGEEITRNMLSQIEHGTARPSMDTLRYLAGRLGKPVSFFLEEEGTVSLNTQIMAQARHALDAENFATAARTLEGYRGPDPVCDREKQLLETLARLGLARDAVEQGREALARGLLAEPVPGDCYCREDLERRRLLLLCRVTEQALALCRELPTLDEELLLRGRAALEAGDGERAIRLLDAVENQKTAQWGLLMGRARLQAGDFSSAAGYLHTAERDCPKETAPLLEHCYRELGDFKLAYEYACKQRK